MENLLSVTKWGSLVDLVVVALIILFCLIGLYEGFIERFMRTISKILSLVLAFALCKPFASLLNALFSLDKGLGRALGKSFANNDALNVEVASYEELTSSLGGNGLPGFLKKALKKVWHNGETTTIAKMLGNVVGKYIVIVISFIALIFIVKIACLIIKKILCKVEEKSIPVLFTNKILGVVIGLVESFVFIYLALFVINILPDSFLSDVQNAIDHSGVCKFLTKHNIFSLIFSSMLNLR